MYGTVHVSYLEIFVLNMCVQMNTDVMLPPPCSVYQEHGCVMVRQIVPVFKANKMKQIAVRRLITTSANFYLSKPQT